MPDERTAWPPHVGDLVTIKSSRLRATVVKTKGAQETRLRLTVLAAATGGDPWSREQRKLARVASRWYGLDDLEPLT
jgi:hypothetical protein